MIVSAKHPLQADTKGRLVTVDEDIAIKQSIQKILETPIGESFFIETFGSKIHKFIFEQNDSILKAMLNHFIADALFEWERRVKLLSITFEDLAENQINCLITYNIVNRNAIAETNFQFNRML